MAQQTPYKFEDLTGKIIAWVGSKSSLYIHTFIFIGCFALIWRGVNVEEILLILTTAVSLEAIYLAIFIQYSVNQQAHTLKNVAEDIEEVTEDVEDISEGVEGISEEVEDISEDMEEITGNLTKRTSSEISPNSKSTYEQIETQLTQLLTQIKQLKNQENKTSIESQK